MENSNKFLFFKGVPLLSSVHDVEHIQRMQDEFEFQDEDVIVMTYPKSGTHWMIHILSLIYSKGDPTWVKSVPYWERCPWIEIKTNMENVKNKANSHLFTSHLPAHLFPKSYFTSKAKILYVCQESKGRPCSLYHFKIISHLTLLYGSWFDHIKGWLPMRNSEKFLFLTYEEIHQNLKVSVEKICQFMGKELIEEEINSVMKNASFQVMKKYILENKEPMPIKNMESAKIMMMRKGICGDWKNHFTVTQKETFNEQYQEKMKGMEQDLFPWDQC
ncbi:bile salt sulfotransferase-like [Sarcophilus harrisii]|uniref:bile salt sulfotransferase-like n=1 Tax=Sarcophilus harrisii TaxID=9305 RepID=UPI001301A922|nr:bile salt sulfotransferase-like [Sarcophilus harrisii]